MHRHYASSPYHFFIESIPSLCFGSAVRLESLVGQFQRPDDRFLLVFLAHDLERNRGVLLRLGVVFQSAHAQHRSGGDRTRLTSTVVVLVHICVEHCPLGLRVDGRVNLGDRQDSSGVIGQVAPASVADPPSSQLYSLTARGKTCSLSPCLLGAQAAAGQMTKSTGRPVEVCDLVAFQYSSASVIYAVRR